MSITYKCSYCQGFVYIAVLPDNTYWYKCSKCRKLNKPLKFLDKLTIDSYKLNIWKEFRGLTIPEAYEKDSSKLLNKIKVLEKDNLVRVLLEKYCEDKDVMGTQDDILYQFYDEYIIKSYNDSIAIVENFPIHILYGVFLYVNKNSTMTYKIFSDYIKSIRIDFTTNNGLDIINFNIGLEMHHLMLDAKDDTDTQIKFKKEVEKYLPKDYVARTKEMFHVIDINKNTPVETTVN